MTKLYPAGVALGPVGLEGDGAGCLQVGPRFRIGVVDDGLVVQPGFYAVADHQKAHLVPLTGLADLVLFVPFVEPFLEVQPMPDTGTLHARMVGPWQDMQGNVLWSPEVWASVHPPLPMAPGTVVPHVRPRMNSLSPRESLDGWTLLFDGRDAATHWRGFRKDELPE